MIIINATITIHRHFLPLPSSSYRPFTVSECSIRAASELRPGNAKRNNHLAPIAKLESCDYSEKRNRNQDTLNSGESLCSFIETDLFGSYSIPLRLESRIVCRATFEGKGKDSKELSSGDC